MAVPLRAELADGVCTLTLDRPEARNALTAAMRDALADRLAEAEADEAVEVVVLAATDPVFCAGVDLEDAVAGGQQARGKANPGAALRRFPKPTLCAVNGACVTGGLEMALACDFIIASEQARFADTHAKLGLLPAWGMSVMLPQAVGARLAREMVATGRFLSAEEALRAGLANRVVAHEALGDTVREIAERITRANGPAVRATLDLMARGQGLDFEAALALEGEAYRSWKPDLAFANKRRQERDRD